MQKLSQNCQKSPQNRRKLPPQNRCKIVKNHCFFRCDNVGQICFVDASSFVVVMGLLAAPVANELKQATFEAYGKIEWGFYGSFQCTKRHYVLCQVQLLLVVLSTKLYLLNRVFNLKFGNFLAFLNKTGR